MKRRFTVWPKTVCNGQPVNSSHGWFVGEPSSVEYGRFMTTRNWTSWTDAYKLFMDAIDKLGVADEQAVEDEVRRVYEFYKGDKYMEEAYRRWCDGDGLY